jgi:hypothetical protein
MKKLLSYIVVAVLSMFGLLTLFLSSSVLFDLFGIREKEGNYVLLVVISNFIASILYLFAAYSFLKNKMFTAKLLYASAAILIAAFAGLLVHINAGGIYETKTIGAMIFRITLTCLLAAAAYLLINKKKRAIKKNSKLCL